jgi:hypothetical protein
LKNRIEFRGSRNQQQKQHQQKVIFNGKTLNNNCDLLKTYGVANNSNLTLGLGLKGGDYVETVDLYS